MNSRCTFFALLPFIVFTTGAASARAQATSLDAESDRARITSYLEQLPLAFEENLGQLDARARFASRCAGLDLFVGPAEAVVVVGRSASSVRLELVGGNSAAEMRGEQRLPGVSHYYGGASASAQVTDVPHFARVVAGDVYPGIDVVYHGRGRELEYDFELAAGADPRAISLRFDGAERVAIDDSGALVITTAEGVLLQRAPVAWQSCGDSRDDVPVRFVLEDEQLVRFELGAYDAARPLTIDPVWSYATFLGGSGRDMAWALAVDSQGQSFLTGETASMQFPATMGVQDMSFNGGVDAFVCKLNPSGTMLLWSTFLGGAGDERGTVIALDHVGLPYVAGHTSSMNFPTTPNAFDRFHNGGADAFVCRLDAFGRIITSTFLGGAGEDVADGLALSPGSSLPFVTGYTRSANFPITLGAFDVSHNGGSDVFVVKLNATLSTVTFSTFVGGSGDDYGSDMNLLAGSIPVVCGWTWSSNFPTPMGPKSAVGGCDAIVFRLNAMGNMLTHARLVGGSMQDRFNGMALDSQGQVYACGFTGSPDYPVQNAFDSSFNGGGFGDACATKLSPDLGTIVFSTYLGGAGNDAASDVFVNSAGLALITGNTESANFPMNAPRTQFTTKNMGYDGWLLQLNAGGNALAYATFFGSSGHDAGFGVGVDGAGLVYVCGYAGANDFPTTMGAIDQTFNGGSFDALAIRLGL